ncbi:glutamate receptor 1-like [Ornithodoros turicata]|uniref:glutamate receptor 1-like n=1 Tax=Ornithodoros turicata TaxID=34597 RepID=UPI0031391619
MGAYAGSVVSSGVLFSIQVLLCALTMPTCYCVEIGVLLKQDHLNVRREFDRSTAFFNASSDAKRLAISIKTHFGQIQDNDLFSTARELCKQLDTGVTTVVLPSDGLSSEALWSLFGNTNVPRISTSVQHRCGPADEESTEEGEWLNTNVTLNPLEPTGDADEEQKEQIPFGVSMVVDLTPAVLDLAKYFNFHSLIFFYESEHGHVQLQRLTSSNNHKITFRYARRISAASEAKTLLREIDEDDPHGRKLVVLDCHFQVAKEIIISHVRDLFMGRRTYHYVLLNPVVSEKYFDGFPELAALNVTAFRFHSDQDEGLRSVFIKMTAEEAALVDASSLVSDAYRALRFDPPPKNSDLFEQRVRPKSFRGDSCGKVSYLTKKQGRVIDTYLKKVTFEGKTGRVQFDSMGCRVNFTVDVIQVNRKRQWKQIGQWTEKAGFVPTPSRRIVDVDVNVTADNDIVYKVTTILEDPYLMLKSTSSLDDVLQANASYEGFCLDLIEAISRLTGIKYQLQLVKDDHYGSLSVSGWNGMIGEVERGDADIALGGLTITSARKNVVDFTHPFLATDIAALSKRPPSLLKKGAGMLTFASPFHLELWIGMGSSLGAVILFLFIFGISVMKRDHCCHEPSEGDQGGSAMLKTFCESLEVVTPHASTSFLARTIAGRILSSTWWMFIVFVFSAYTVYLAPFLVLHDSSLQDKTIIHSFEDLSLQHEVRFGTLQHGSIQEYFEESTYRTNKRMWEAMKADRSVLVANRQEGVQRVRDSSGKYVFLTESLFAEYINGRRPCDTWTLGESFSTQFFALAVRLGSPLRNVLNEAITNLSENGEIEEMKKKWWTSECEKPPEDIPLNAEVFYPLLFLLGCVTAVGITIAFFEIISRACVKCQRVKVAQGPPTVNVSYERDVPLKTIA